MERRVHEFFMTPISLIGTGCLAKLAEYIKPMRFRKALIVTDHFLSNSPLIRHLTSVLDSLGLFYIFHDEVKPNPTTQNVRQGLKIYRDNGCDFLISFGGGSPHDCAKAIALLASNGGHIQDYEGLNKMSKPSATLIAVNTTAGTGSELTRYCVITDEERKIKMTISDWHITPCIAVNDAALMLDLPPALTATTGMDALTHAIEAYVSTDATPVTDCKALKAVELIARHLRQAVSSGKDIAAREGMIYAAYLAGIAFNNANLGYVHSTAHQLGGYYNLPHGLCNALMLPAVSAFNAETVPQKFVDIAQAFGIETLKQQPSQSIQALLTQITALSRDIGIPAGLREIKGFDVQDIPALAANALRDVCSLSNPRKASQPEMENLFRAAL